MEAREPKEIEDPRTAIFVRGTHTGEIVNGVMKDLVRPPYHLYQQPFINKIIDGFKKTQRHFLFKEKRYPSFRRRLFTRILGTQERRQFLPHRPKHEKATQRTYFRLSPTPLDWMHSRCY